MNRLYRLGLPIAVLLLAACGTVATPVWSEQAQGTEAALLATSEYETQIAPTATPLPPTATATEVPATATPIPPTATETSIPPTDVPTLAPTATLVTVAGDAQKGMELFNTMREETNFACATCHLVDSEERLIGPGLLNVSVRAETRVAGQTAEEYIHNSIIHPSDYVVADYPDALMPQVYADIFTEEQIQDLVAYLFTLKG